MRSQQAHAATPVAIVGAGPVGLSLALGLAREGIPSTLLEREPGTSRYSKAAGIHVRTREIFRRWSVEERMLAAGHLHETLSLRDVHPRRDVVFELDFRELAQEADRPGVLFLEQERTEALLLEAVRDSGLCDVRFGAEAVHLEPGVGGVQLILQQGGARRALEAEYVVGCDGARSFVRGALGLPFQGMTYALRPLLADVRIEDERDALPWPRIHARGRGYLFALRIRPGLWRIVHLEPQTRAVQDEVSEGDVRERVVQLFGDGPFELVWASRFRIHQRSAPRFRVGRVLLAGDAAHVHSPAGGLGMNAGVQDSHNLAWKLAAALRGGDVDRLLDSYEAERQATVVEGVSRYTDLVTRLFFQTPPSVRAGATSLVGWLFRIPLLRRRNLRRMAMIDVDYAASPLIDDDASPAGMRLPNPLLRSPTGGEARLYDLLPPGPSLLDVAEERAFAEELPLEPVVRIGPGAYRDPGGTLRALLRRRDGWILVRPDMHVAWAREHEGGMADATRVALGRQSSARSAGSRERTSKGRRTPVRRERGPARGSVIGHGGKTS